MSYLVQSRTPRARRISGIERLWMACIINAAESIMRTPSANIRKKELLRIAAEIQYDWAWLLTVGVVIARHIEHLGARISPDLIRDWAVFHTPKVRAWRELALRVKQNRRRKR